MGRSARRREAARDAFERGEKGRVAYSGSAAGRVHATHVHHAGRAAAAAQARRVRRVAGGVPVREFRCPECCGWLVGSASFLAA